MLTAVQGVTATGTYQSLQPTAQVRQNMPAPPAPPPESGLKRLPESAIRLLQPFLPRLDMRSVRIDDSSAYSQWLVDNANASAMTIGSTIFIQKGQYNTDTVEGLALIGHELTHVQQYRERSYEGFFWWYGTDYLRSVLTKHDSHFDAYREIRAEQEAYAMGDRIRAALRGKLPQRISTSG